MMKMESRIPPEIRAALSTGMGFSLLLKGEPGTGKTMLAFEILDEFGGENAAYLSTRVSLPALYSQFPWLEERAGFSAVDATKLYLSSKGFTGLRSFSDTLYKKLAEAEKPATLVIDSWEAIISGGGKEEKKEVLEAALTDLVRNYATQYKMNLILIAETSATTPLDYIVDGIVEMTRIDIDYRRGRQLVLKKLRGTRIDQHKYGFTLDGGRFRHFGPFERRKIEKARKIEVVPNTAKYISTGCAGIDTILGGGMATGSTHIVEYGDDLSLLGYHSLIAHMIINSIQQGVNVVKIPLSGWDERRLRRGILPFVKEEDYLKYLTVFEIRKEKKEVRENVQVLKGESMEEDFSILTDFIASLEPPVVVIIGTDTLEYQYRLKVSGNLERMAELFSYWVMEMREAENVGVFGMPAGGVLGTELGHMATNHFKMSVLDRSVIFYCNRPDTKLHCLENIITTEALKLRTTPFL
ncbi:MAG TPA: gas vesicle protein GvpD P-loop domain-containing protein [Candidatus Bathyarchaeia archaeon]|nr:gas vesicle protein GvpD P-loop domain-containing protein [Candidatus Bathyarchaeia archaeon]